MSFSNSKVTAYQGGTWTITSSSKTLLSVYNSVSSVSSSILTTILSYTVPVGKTDYLGKIEISGTNTAQYEIFINGNPNGLKRTYFGGSLNETLDYSFGNETGLKLNTGDIVEVKVIHGRPSLGDFEARLIIAEE